MQSRQRIFVIGADGQIGRYLYERLNQEKRWEVIGTTRRKSKVNPTYRYVDLEDTSCTPENLGVTHGDSVIFSAAITKRQACEDDPKQSHFINVTQSLNYLQYFMDKGIFCIFLSTNMVLGSNQAFYKIDSDYAPTDLYASQKAEVEQTLKSMDQERTKLAILRLTKVMDHASPLLKEWRDNLRKGKEITAFTDLMLAPINYKIVGDAVISLLDKRCAGIFHLSCRDELSYFKFAQRLFAEKYASFIISSYYKNQGSKIIHNSLEVQETERILTIKCPSIDAIIHHLR